MGASRPYYYPATGRQAPPSDWLVYVVYIVAILAGLFAVAGAVVGIVAFVRFSALEAKYNALAHGVAVARVPTEVASWLATPITGGTASYNITVVSVGTEKTLYMTALDVFALPTPPGDVITFGPGTIPAIHLPYGVNGGLLPLVKYDSSVVVQTLDIYDVLDTQVYVFADGSVLVAPKYWNPSAGQAQTLAGSLFTPALNGKAFESGMQTITYSNASAPGPPLSNVLFASASVNFSAADMRALALANYQAPPPPPSAQVESWTVPVFDLAAPGVVNLTVYTTADGLKLLYMSTPTWWLINGNDDIYFDVGSIPPQHMPPLNNGFSAIFTVFMNDPFYTPMPWAISIFYDGSAQLFPFGLAGYLGLNTVFATWSDPSLQNTQVMPSSAPLVYTSSISLSAMMMPPAWLNMTGYHSVAAAYGAFLRTTNGTRLH